MKNNLVKRFSPKQAGTFLFTEQLLLSLLIRYINRFVILVLLALTFSCASGNRPRLEEGYKPDSMYKKWFFNTPSRMVVGYPLYERDFHKDGKIRLSGYAKTRVKGFIRQYSDEDTFDEQDSILFFYDIDDSSAFYSAVVLDSFFISKYYVYLISTGSGGFDTTRQHIYGHKRPEWLNSLPVENEMLYARGESRFLYYDQASSWMKAEENAIKHLCQKSAFHFASLQKYHENGTGNQLSETYKLSVDLLVQGITVNERYYDPVNRMCYVLVSCRKSEIVSYKE